MPMGRTVAFSPNSRCTQRIEGRIACHQRNTFDQALLREHAVEWIAVLAQQSTRSQGMKVANRQVPKAIKPYQFVETGHCIAPDVRFAQAALGGNLPCAGRADQELVAFVLDQLTYLGRVPDHPSTTIAGRAYLECISPRFPGIQIFFCQWLEKRFCDPSLQAAGLTTGTAAFKRHKSGEWLTCFRQKDFLPRMRLFQ